MRRAPATSRAAERLVADDPQDRGGDLGRVVRGDDQRRVAFAQQLGHRADPRDDGRAAGDGGLERHPAEGLVHPGRIDDHVGGRVDVGDLVDEATELDLRLQPQLRDQPGQVLAVGEVLRPRERVAGDHQPRLRRRLEHRGHRPDEHVLSLPSVRYPAAAISGASGAIPCSSRKPGPSPVA